MWLEGLEGLLEVAERYEWEGRFRDAAVAYDQALVLDPGDERARRGLRRTGKIEYIMRDMRHKWAIITVDWSPDGQYVLSACLNGIINIWDVRSGRLVRGYKTLDYIQDVAWSPDGQYIAVGEERGLVIIRDVFTGRVVWRFEYDGRLRDLAWSPDGRYIAVGGFADVVYILDFVERKKVMELPCRFPDESGVFYGYAVHVVTWSPDGKYLVSGSEDCFLRLWDVEGRKLVRMIEDEELCSVSMIDWSSDGRYVAISSRGKNVKIWVGGELKLWKVIRCGDDVVSIKWSPDGKLIACGLSSGFIEIWDPRMEEKVMVLRVGGSSVSSLSWSPNGRYIVSGDATGMIDVQDLETGETFSLCIKGGHERGILGALPSPNRKYIISWSGDRIVSVWEWGSWKKLMSIKHRCYFSYQTWDPDDRFFIGILVRDGVVKIWDVDERGEIAVFAEKKYVSASWHPKGKYVALSASDGTIEIWNIENWDLIKILRRLREGGGVAYWISDGRYIVGTCGKERACVWDVENESIVSDITMHEGIKKLIHSPRGRVIAFTSWQREGVITLWDWKKNYISTITTGESSIVSIAWSPDERYLAYASPSSIKVWDVRRSSLEVAINIDMAIMNIVWQEPDRIFVSTANGDFLYAYPFM